MGNPILYKDLKLTWNKEGTLKSLSNYSYIYDANKVRIIKKSNDDSYKEVYVTDGTKILRRKILINNKEKYFFDYLWNVDNLIGFIYNNAKYFFVKNIQGDITHILNQDGEIVAKYIYDAFGNHKVLDSEGNIDTNQYSLGNLNPYRYRGYYFDSETGLYYLQSRYYDPELGRFILPDSVEYLDASSINGLNLYCYCLNDPVNKVDPNGHFAILSFLLSVVIAAGIGAIVGACSYTASEVVSYLFTGEFTWSWAQFAGCTIGGAIGGALSAIPGVGAMVTAGVTGFLSTSIGMALQNRLEGTNYSLGQILFVSTISGLISASMAGLFSTRSIPGITSGDNNYSELTDKIVSGLFKGTISKVSFGDFTNMLAYNMIGSIYGTGISAVFDITNGNDILSQFFYERTNC